MPLGQSTRALVRLPVSLTSRRTAARGGSLAASFLVAGLVLTGISVPAEAATVYRAPLRTAVKSLPVAAENNTGYDRTRYFGSWKDTDRDCQNTRAEVLLQETRATASYTTAQRCTLKKGRWVTSWDDRTHYYASAVEIDHTVPVHEAWGSGAKRWTQARRTAFYNDLGDHRSLNAQTASLNSAKQAKGPEAWLPPRNRCAYVQQWVAVKIRWGLTVDSTEKASLTRLASTCADVSLTVTKA